MAKLDPNQEVARRTLSRGFTLIAYAMPGENRAQFRIVHENDQNLSLHVSAEDTVALCAMITPPRG